MSVLSYTYGVKTRFCFIFFLIFMKTEKRFFNSYVFLRRYFNIPKGKRLRWCVIRESSAKGTELRLGVSVAGTNKYIDIAQRRIFSETSSGLIDRCVFPARRSCFGKNYVYTHRKRLVDHQTQRLHHGRLQKFVVASGHYRKGEIPLSKKACRP